MSVVDQLKNLLAKKKSAEAAGEDHAASLSLGSPEATMDPVATDATSAAQAHDCVIAEADDPDCRSTPWTQLPESRAVGGSAAWAAAASSAHQRVLFTLAGCLAGGAGLGGRASR